MSDHQAQSFVGIDVGGTRHQARVFSGDLELQTMATVDTASLPTPESALEWVQERLADFSREILGYPQGFSAIGFSCPGIYDSDAGELVTAANLPSWERFPLRERLTATLGAPFLIANDAEAACYGEYCVRDSCESAESFVFLGIGTGVGAGFIINGRPLKGFHGSAAECGHLIVETGPDAKLCGCGIPGHLEAYVGHAALMARAAELLPDQTDLRSTFDLFQLAEAGSSQALELIQECAHYLGIGIGQIRTMLDPEIVVLGGGVTFGGARHPIGRDFLNTVKKVATEHCIVGQANRSKIEFAELGDRAGVLGSAALARDFVSRSHTNTDAYSNTRNVSCS